MTPPLVKLVALFLHAIILGWQRSHRIAEKMGNRPAHDLDDLLLTCRKPRRDSAYADCHHRLYWQQRTDHACSGHEQGGSVDIALTAIDSNVFHHFAKHELLRVGTHLRVEGADDQSYGTVLLSTQERQPKIR